MCQLWLFFQLALKNEELSTSLVNFYGYLHGFLLFRRSGDHHSFTGSTSYKVMHV